jgi:hypothetical protein
MIARSARLGECCALFPGAPTAIRWRMAVKSRSAGGPLTIFLPCHHERRRPFAGEWLSSRRIYAIWIRRWPSQGVLPLCGRNPLFSFANCSRVWNASIGTSRLRSANCTEERIHLTSWPIYPIRSGKNERRRKPNPNHKIGESSQRSYRAL